MELLAYWQIIRKRWLLILALALLTTLATAVVIIQQPPTYRTTTTLFLNPGATNPLLPLQVTPSIQATANTYAELMRTRAFAAMVVERSGLALTEEDVLKALSTQYVQDTQFFRLMATHPDPNAAQVIAQTAAETLIAQNVARNQAAQAQLASQRNQDPQNQRRIELRDALRDELDFYNQRISNTRDQITNLEARQPSERNDQRLGELRGDLVALQNSRTATLNSLAQVEALLEAANTSASAAPSDTAVVVDPAPFPQEPLPSNLWRNLLLALLLGLGTGIALAFALEYLDYTVRSPEALEAVYGKPTLGVIAALSSRPHPGEGSDPSYQLTASEPRSPAAEAIRALRTSVQVAGLERPLNSLMVTSAAPGEGKSFVAANLAVSLALYGQTVILVDLDLRKPYLHTVFGLPREPGFSNLVLGHEAERLAQARPAIEELQAALQHQSGRARSLSTPTTLRQAPLTMSSVERLLRRAESGAPHLVDLAEEVRELLAQADQLEDYLRPTEIPNLFVLTCGTIPAQPSELIGANRAAQVHQRLTDYADLVIYDTPPVGVITDAAILAPRVDATLQVVRAGSTRIDMIQRCQATLAQAGATLIGPVLNYVQARDLGSYSYYYYYGYGQNRNLQPAPTETIRSNGNGKQPPA